MELSIFLGQVIGAYLVIIGLVAISRWRYFMPVVDSLGEERLMRLVIGCFELLLGLFLVVLHNVWSPLPAALVSLFGWLMVLEGTFYLFVSDALVAKMIRLANRRGMYVWGGSVAIVVGLYLLRFGLAWF